ncbi:bifunctional hydroxymethylpyrimidine kinase/phosphomethylpyrimidine kinase [Peptostreptococcus equinus]|uniref:Hydroxymethylpyrimidine/phosphomethylpyrimidine kinase n=1 Tax=Peptostreptococcus equinus TaxID=3003601 RepID=A0ABY7JQH0_9FIRM|nr:bifunctional hydroxymethylpyrimidine kinase/phosphomethylpyrimidine kinase [Peptostreptococcus sp. CBA3647]WAW15409.1 bifunctional hydroxymethylpyrimidine kinase/phosphomethylpyrimidine kinase [Peptostreptococcus sp. CBA3647]
MKRVLTIAGSDSSGGAGIQTDLKTFAAHGVYGMSAITAVTAQNTMGVNLIENISPEMILAQIDAVFTDIEVDAVKIGMLSNSNIVRSVYEGLKKYKAKNIVLDPVMISTSGFDLIDDFAKNELINKLFSLAEIITPNIMEAQCIYRLLFDKEIEISTKEDMAKAGKEIQKTTGKYVLIKGGHLDENPCDVLIDKESREYFFTNVRIDTKNTHGTGCTLSSSIASNLGLGFDMIRSVKKSKEFITMAIEYSLDIGHGCGPTNPMGKIYEDLKFEL